MKEFKRIAGLRAGINGGGAGASLSDGTGAASAPVMNKRQQSSRAGGAGAVRGSHHAGGAFLALLCVFALTLCFTACPGEDDDTPTYTVTFNSNDGTAVEAQTVTEGGKATAPAAPTKALTLTAAGFYTNYTFGGWYKEAALTTAWDFDTDTVTADITLYAKWTGGAIDTTTQTGTTVIDKAVAWLTANAAANTTYTLVLDSGFSQAPVTLSGLAADNITLVVTTRDDTERVVELSTSGSLFTVGAGSGSTVTLRLDRRVTLKGRSGNTAALVVVSAAGTLEAQGNAKITGNTSGTGGGVYVAGGTFIMSGGASVSGNSTAEGGGGVCVGSGTFTMTGGSVSDNSTSSFGGGGVIVTGGAFTMTGGSVSGNSANYGGGVYVYAGGTFTMSGSASVSGNSASYGGGVWVAGGSFTMNGGRIQGSADSDGFTKNTASIGAALYTNGGTAKFGAASTNCKVGATSKAAGADIGNTSETITATGTGS